MAAPREREPPAPQARLSRERRAIEARDATAGRNHETLDTTAARRTRERRVAEGRAGSRAGRSSRGRSAAAGGARTRSAARGPALDKRSATHETRTGLEQDAARTRPRGDEDLLEALALDETPARPISSTHDLFAVDDVPADDAEDASRPAQREPERSPGSEDSAPHVERDALHQEQGRHPGRSADLEPATAIDGTILPSAAPAASDALEAAAPALEVHGAIGASDADDAADAIDAEIGEALAAGDTRRALALCAELHGESIGRFCMALLGSQAEADAITEEVLLEAYRHPDELALERPIRGWLLGLARRSCARVSERRPKRRAAADVTPAAEEPEDVARARQARALIEHVRPSEREALVLRFAADASTREVARACNIEPAEAQRRVSRALGRLRDALENEASDE